MIRSTPVFVVGKTLLLGAAGGALLNQFGLPLAWMLGSLFVSAVGPRIFGEMRVPRAMRDVLIPALGVLLGSSFTPDLLDQLPRWPVGLLTVAVYVSFAVLLGSIYFRKVAKLDPITSYFAAVPGGLSDLTLVGAALGANLGVLAIVHSMRIIVVVITIPVGLGLFANPGNMGAAPTTMAHDLLSLSDFVALVACGALGAGLGRLLRLPAAPVIGPLFVSAAAHFLGLTAVVPPPWLIAVVQVVLGGYIGSRIAQMGGTQIRNALLHGIFWGILMVTLAAGAAFACSLGSSLEFSSILLGLAPGGLPEMAIVTLALGIDIAFVTTCHLARLVVVYLMTPMVVGLGGWRSIGVKGARDSGGPRV